MRLMFLNLKTSY